MKDAEIARKHCGQNPFWRFKVETLHERTGSTSTLSEFRRMIKAIIDDNKKLDHMPDYTFELENDVVTMKPRPEFLERYDGPKQPGSIDNNISLKTQTYENARKIAGGWDLYFLEEEWRSMLGQKEEVPERPDGSFVGFVKWYVAEHGRAR